MNHHSYLRHHVKKYQRAVNHDSGYIKSNIDNYQDGI